MPMLIYISFGLLLVFRRIFLISLPFFWHSSKSNLMINLAVGILSDISLIAAIVALGMLLTRLSGRRFGLIAMTALLFGVAIYCSIEIRYVEHFGLTPRPYHLAALNTGEVWIAGAEMLTETWRSATLLGFAALFILLGVRVRLEETARKQKLVGFFGALVIFAGCHSGMLNLRQKPGVNSELRYNPLVALYYNFRAGSSESLTLANAAELLAARRFFSPRKFEDDRYPMWQSGLNDQSSKNLLAQGTSNVIVIVSESLRAKELSTPRSGILLYPEVSQLIKEGLYFSNVFAAGNATHYGQSAINCSVYGVKNFTLIHDVPLNRARCLTDIFRSRGYETGFFYGGDNHFDNQQEFYSFHTTDNIYGAVDFGENKGYARGGWGYSDKSLFDFTLETLKKSQKPFFSLVLTLSNHAPFVLPEDAPAEIATLPVAIREKISRYVDWSTAAFIRQVRTEYPNTIIVLTADHGMFWDDRVLEGIPDEELLKSISRIPLLVIGDPLSQTLRGTVIPNLGSSVDIGPTLLSILGWHDEPNQFMGESIFSRSHPIYMDWRDTLITIRESADGLVIGEADPALPIALRTLLQNNQLAPAGVPY